MGKISETYKREWFLIDAEGKTLGRLATKIARILQGKHKATYSANEDRGDFVIVVNAEKIKVTGRKEFQKDYFQHSGFLGGLKVSAFSDVLQKHPNRIIEHAVNGMLPKNKLRDLRKKRLKIYKGQTDRHKAQKPIVIE
jgi:large subunit ribosomal protein L13